MNHIFDIEHAGAYGLPAAVLITNFQYWIARNKANETNLRDGRTWTYNTVDALCLQFPYLTKDQIRRALEKLVDAGVMMAGCFNDSRVDRTKWYAFADESKFLPHLAKLPNATGKGAKSDLANLPNAVGADAKTLDTDVNPNITTDDDGVAPLPKAGKVRATRLPNDFVLPKKWGEWALTQYPAWGVEYIRLMGEKFRDHWCAVGGSKGCKLDWLATWRNFCRADYGPKKLASSSAGPWNATESGILAKGAELGLTPNPGELTRSFMHRIEAAIEDAGKPKQAPQPSRLPQPFTPLPGDMPGASGKASAPPARKFPPGALKDLLNPTMKQKKDKNK